MIRWKRIENRKFDIFFECYQGETIERNRIFNVFLLHIYLENNNQKGANKNQ